VPAVGRPKNGKEERAKKKKRYLHTATATTYGWYAFKRRRWSISSLEATRGLVSLMMILYYTLADGYCFGY